MLGEPTKIVDVAEIRFRADTVGAGLRLYLVVFAAGMAYVGVTWAAPNRTLIFALFAGLLLATVAMAALSAREARRSRREGLVLLAWSLCTIAITGALAAADGGASSPLAALFFLPIVFAALSYPLVLVVVVSAVSELVFATVASLWGVPDPARVAFFAACLAFTAVLCALQAQNHDRRREELARTSRVDPLTGSLNRRGFEERLAAELDQGLRSGRPLSLVVLDLDRFKEVNDTKGHAAGDQLLCWTVAAMQSALRPMDCVGRLGGDEFAVLLPGAGQSDGREGATRLCELLSKRVAAAAGVASFPAHGVEQEELLRHADAELYATKRGRERTPVPGRRELSWAAALARAVDLRTAGPDGHSTQVALYAAEIAERLGWSSAELGLLRMAAMLHDVGKVSVPDRILSKAGPLTDEEFAEIKKHPSTGADLMGRVDGLEPVLAWIRHSHEHFDGSGYPDGLSGEAIPPASRILLLADAFDALTSSRPYREAVSIEAAMEELRRSAGRQFDPRCLEALEDCVADPQVEV